MVAGVVAEASLQPHVAAPRVVAAGGARAEPLKCVFEIDVLTCPWCGGKCKLIALITDGKVVRRILGHSGFRLRPRLSLRPAPPEHEFTW